MPARAGQSRMRCLRVPKGNSVTGTRIITSSAGMVCRRAETHARQRLCPDQPASIHRVWGHDLPATTEHSRLRCRAVHSPESVGDCFGLSNLHTGRMRAPAPLTALDIDGSRFSIRDHRQRLTASVTATFTAAGESRARSRVVPVSVVILVASRTSHPIRRADATRAPAGPRTIAHGLLAPPTVVKAVLQLLRRISVGIQAL